jgi:ABC-type nitrate/sulfonate/bicarbonate transport system substrate-binding protein
MKRLFFCFILSVALPVTTLAQTPPEPVRITYASRTIESVLLFVAQEKRFFREEGLEVQPVLTGGTTAIAAAINGDVEGIHIMGSAIRAIQRGLALKVVAVNLKRPLFWLVTRPEVENFGALKKKVMGVVTFGGTQQLAGYYMLRKGGLDPEKEITTAIVGDIPTQLQALAAGSIQIGVFSPPTVIVARDKYKMRLLATTSDQYYALQAGLTVSERMLKDKRPLIKGMLRAMTKANRFFFENEKESAEIIAKTYKVDLPTAIGTYRLTRPTFSRDGTATENEMEEHLKVDAQTLGLKEPTAPSRVFDFSLQREVNGELGVR